MLNKAALVVVGVGASTLVLGAGGHEPSQSGRSVNVYSMLPANPSNACVGRG